MASRKKPSASVAAYKRGYKTAWKEAQSRVEQIVTEIEVDINKRCGLSPMLWNDRDKRDEIISRWISLGELVME